MYRKTHAQMYPRTAFLSRVPPVYLTPTLSEAWSRWSNQRSTIPHSPLLSTRSRAHHLFLTLPTCALPWVLLTNFPLPQTSLGSQDRTGWDSDHNLALGHSGLPMFVLCSPHLDTVILRCPPPYPFILPSFIPPSSSYSTHLP